MASSHIKLPDKGRALFDVRANDDEAYEFVQELRLFLQAYRNSGPHRVKDASAVNIPVSTIQPDFEFKLCLCQTDLQRQYTLACNYKSSGDFDHYRISDFRAKDGKKLIPLKTWLTPRIRALTNVL
ncbi:hypothetical protein E8E13_001684 [Curvularia kusanoi]|uniref:Uncharacterized protein n=1 Tax=Curvularia kusanoi TaxID=90978 RepID=A0A9P4T4W0_CURKU|nr:hypothetical protein E8E13_001684 [Curvularia kusanoi]